jgi:hypothetical protein
MIYFYSKVDPAILRDSKVVRTGEKRGMSAIYVRGVPNDKIPLKNILNPTHLSAKIVTTLVKIKYN